MGCGNCQDINEEDCESVVCKISIPASCVVVAPMDCCGEFEEDTAQNVILKFCNRIDGTGFTGTVLNPTSVTVVCGLITDAS